MKQQRCMSSEMSELYLHINDMSNFFTKLSSNFKIFEENFLDFFMLFHNVMARDLAHFSI